VESVDTLDLKSSGQ